MFTSNHAPMLAAARNGGTRYYYGLSNLRRAGAAYFVQERQNIRAAERADYLRALTLEHLEAQREAAAEAMIEQADRDFWLDDESERWDAFDEDEDALMAEAYAALAAYDRANDDTEALAWTEAGWGTSLDRSELFGGGFIIRARP